jgi:hypothetical protein
MVNATLDDSANKINYAGFAKGGTSNVQILPDPLVSQSQDRTLSFTATKHANATVAFTGNHELSNKLTFRCVLS